MDDGKDQAGFARATTTAMSEMTLQHGQEAAQVHAMPGAEMSANMDGVAAVPRTPRAPVPQDPGSGGAA